jgi:hypothetical protein
MLTSRCRFASVATTHSIYCFRINMDQNPKEQAVWNFLTLTVFKIHTESARTDPDLQRLVILINALHANIGRRANSEPPDNHPEVTAPICKGNERQRSSDGRGDFDNTNDCNDCDYPQDSRDTSNPNRPNNLLQTSSPADEPRQVLEHHHTGDNMTWQAYRGSCATYVAHRVNQC